MMRPCDGSCAHIVALDRHRTDNEIDALKHELAIAIADNARLREINRRLREGKM